MDSGDRLPRLKSLLYQLLVVGVGQVTFFSLIFLHLNNRKNNSTYIIPML